MSFTIEILEEKRNILINRTELTIKIDHYGKGSPNRLDVKKKVASIQGSNEKLTIVKKILAHFGSTQDIGKIYIYDNDEDLKLYEPFHIRVRNLPKDKRVDIYKLKKKKEPYKHLFEYD